MDRWAWLTGAIIFEVGATLSLKGALDFPILYTVIVVGYLIAFICLSQTLKAGMPLGVAYGVWGSAGVALTALLAHLIFAEPLTLVMWLGILLVIIGVLFVEIGSQHASQHLTKQHLTKEHSTKERAT